jgi:hypothetical protein
MPEGTGYDEITSAMDAQDEAEGQEAEVAKQKEQREALVTKWASKVKRARKQWADDRRVARNDPPEGQAPWLVDTNLIGAIMEVLAAFLYAKNPDVSIRPSETVNRAELSNYRKVSDTLEIMCSRLLHDAYLKRTAKRWVRGAMTVGINWIKAAMQTRTERDPLTETQLNDLQDNLKRIEVKQAQLKDGEADETGPEAEVIRDNIRALEAKLEREVAEGLVLDLMAPEDVIVAPDCGEVENYLNAPWIAFDMYKDRDTALSLTGWTGDDAENLKTANLYMQRPRRGEGEECGSGVPANQWIQESGEQNTEAENEDGFYRFTEIWSLNDGIVYTMVDGIKTKWAREPYAPRTGSRFYPCFSLAFHYIDGDRWPQSDVYQLKRLQEEYARTRSGFAEHRRRAIPGIVFDETMIDPDSITKLTKSDTQEYIGIKPLKPNVDLRTIMAPKLYNNIDAALYDTEIIVKEMEKVSGAQDAVMGSVQVEKTATEAQIQESGRGARTGARLDMLEDSLTELAEYVVQLMLQTMDKADAIRYAGPDATWVEMNTDQALSLFGVQIKAGSTGKPKANSDREAWGTLLPLFEGLIDRIGNARMQGQEWAAKPWIAMLEESRNRLDDFADIEKFLPVPPPEVVKANMNQELSTAEKAEIGQDQADMLKKLSETLEKNPLFAGPARMVVEDAMGQEAPPEIPGGEELPPAPNPLPTGVQ